MANDSTIRGLERLVAEMDRVRAAAAKAPVASAGPPQAPGERGDGGSRPRQPAAQELLTTAGGLAAREERAPSSSPADSRAQADQLSRQLAELAAVARLQAEVIETNTSAVIENSLAKAGGGGPTAGSIGRTILSIVGSGLGLGKLMGQFLGGSSQEAKVALPLYTPPASLNLEAGITGGGQGVQAIRYAADGLPRAVSGAKLQAPAVTVQVQAMDSRSFLDHSAEIAQAVKEALLTSHSLNDVVDED